MNKKLVFAALLATIATPSWSYMAMTDDQIRQLIMQGSITEYTERYGTSSCPCPYSPGKGGHNCGIDSGYYQGEGAVSLRCYPRDVTEEEVDQYRLEYGIPRRIP